MLQSERKFKVMGGHIQHDVCDYIASMHAERSLDIHVGCDSQNYKRYTVYVTTVVSGIPITVRMSSTGENAFPKSRTFGPNYGGRPSDL